MTDKRVKAKQWENCEGWVYMNALDLCGNKMQLFISYCVLKNIDVIHLYTHNISVYSAMHMVMFVWHGIWNTEHFCNDDARDWFDGRCSMHSEILRCLQFGLLRGVFNSVTLIYQSSCFFLPFSYFNLCSVKLVSCYTGVCRFDLKCF